MRGINTENMLWEIEDTMKSNFRGTTKQRYKQAKKLFLESVGEAIEDNKEELLKGVK